MAAELNYSALDRLVHRLAFGAPVVQMMAAEIEESLFGRAYAEVEVREPVFITSLPRAGTTVLLEALNRLPRVATHLYRDMPFVMAPLLWSRLTGRFRKPGGLGERAHGDGLEIGYDSPEAFEEVVWKALRRDKYAGPRFPLWSEGDASEEARRVLRAHMRKIIALRRPEGGRYVSKNNGNLARLDILPRLFPDAVILVPLRRPAAHAMSLLRQHRGFLERHARDPFARRYMADIGHFEFGALHRPIAFPGLDERIAGRDPLGLDYWLGYWIAAYEHVRARRERLILVSHEALCQAPREGLARLSAALEIAADGDLAPAVGMYRAPTAGPGASLPAHDPDLLGEAEALHAELLGSALA